MASMMASCEYMLIGVLYWAWTMVAFPPGPFTSMGLWVDRAESFSAFGLKLGVYSTLSRSGVRGQWVSGGFQVLRGWPRGGAEKRKPDQHVATQLKRKCGCFTMNKARPQP